MLCSHSCTNDFPCCCLFLFVLALLLIMPVAFLYWMIPCRFPLYLITITQGHFLHATFAMSNTLCMCLVLMFQWKYCPLWASSWFSASNTGVISSFSTICLWWSLPHFSIYFSPCFIVLAYNSVECLRAWQFFVFYFVHNLENVILLTLTNQCQWVKSIREFF